MTRSPKFQHRHYAVIAGAIANTETRAELVRALTGAFERDNPNFDLYRFTSAMTGAATHKKDERNAHV